MVQIDIDKLFGRLKNPHDGFCRCTAFHPLYAPDFLKSYGDPVLRELIDLDNLQAAPTVYLSNSLKELRMDASLTTRFLNTQSMSEVLFHLEHKSKPSRTVALHLLAEVGLSLRFRWLLAKRPESGNFEPPIPLMVVVYNGNEDWEGEIWFQDLYPNLPERVRSFVPQFRVFVINLRHFNYGNLPGRPETQAIAESLKRATDGTFATHLPGVLKHVAVAHLGDPLQLDLTTTILSYCDGVARPTVEQLFNAVTTAFNEQEAIKMIETIKNSFVLEGIEIGKVTEKINDIMKTLRVRFKQVPDSIVDELNRRTDLIALESIFEAALQSNSIDEFSDALK
jgi:hypothetical protein